MLTRCVPGRHTPTVLFSFFSFSRAFFLLQVLVTRFESREIRAAREQAAARRKGKSGVASAHVPTSIFQLPGRSVPFLGVLMS